MGDNRRSNNRAKVPNPYEFDDSEPTLPYLKKWFNNTNNYFKQNDENLQFFDGDIHATWTAKKFDPTRGMLIEARAAVPAVIADPANNVLAQPEITEITADEALRQTRVLRRDLDTMLSSYASYIPEGFYDMIMEDCTSVPWIFDRLAASYNLESTKQYFLNSHLIKYTPDDGDTPEKLYIRLRAHYKAAAPKTGDNFDGRRLTGDVHLNELSELMLVEKVLERVDPRLPAHVMKTRGHLMEDGEKTLFCIKRLLWNQLDDMILEMDTSENISSMVTARQVTGGFRRNGSSKNKFSSKNKGEKSKYSEKTRYASDNKGKRSEMMCGACFRAGRRETVYSSHNIDTCSFLSKSDKHSLVRAVSSWDDYKKEEQDSDDDSEHEDDSSDNDEA